MQLQQKMMLLMFVYGFMKVRAVKVCAKSGIGRGGRILRQFSHLVSELGDLFGQFRILLDKRFIDFNKFSNLFFKFRDAANIELFCFSSQVSSSSLPTRLLLDKFRAFA